MITGLTLNTNAVKVRSDVYDATEAISTAGVAAGAFEIPNTSCAFAGVATEAITAGTQGQYVYKADKIVVPADLDGDVAAGQPAYMHSDNDAVTDATTSGIIVGFFREVTASTATEAEIALSGFLYAVTVET